MTTFAMVGRGVRRHAVNPTDPTRTMCGREVRTTTGDWSWCPMCRMCREALGWPASTTAPKKGNR